MLHGNKVTSNSRRKSILREDVIHLKSFDFHFKIIHQRTIGLTWCNCGKSWKLKGYIMCRRLYGSPHREINLPTPVSHKQTEQLELRFSTKKSRIAWVWNKWTAGVCRDWLRGLRLSLALFHTWSFIQKCSWNYLCQVYDYTGAEMPQNAAAKLFAAN